MRFKTLILIIILFIPSGIHLGCAKAKHVFKKSSEDKNTLVLVYKNAFDPIGLVGVFLKEIRLMGYEALDLSSAVKRNRDSKKCQCAYGSGFFISEDGLFITAYHVIERAETIILKKVNGNSLRARVIIEDPITDIAILSTVEEQKVNCWLSLGNYHNTNIGDTIKVIGYPVPELFGSKPKLSKGFVSSNFGLKGDPTKFEIRAPILRGYSGAAIVNARNEVIGLVSEQMDDYIFLTRTGPLPPEINFAAKIDYAKSLLELCLGGKISWEDSNINNVQDAIDSTALVLVNTEKLSSVSSDFLPKKPARTILVEFSSLFYFYIIRYTLFEFKDEWAQKETAEVLINGSIAGSVGSSADEIAGVIIREMRMKARL